MNSPEPFSSPQRRRLQIRLLTWFDENRRELPWRKNRDPYRIWVSEVMLQQTTVKAVTPMFIKFVERFPSVVELAKASEQDVLHAWQGLGYYRRARWLHQAARQIVSLFNGEFPTTADAWDTLPGIGRYTRNAILSQAFNQSMPIVEANSLRVLTRLHASQLDPKSSAGVAWLWSVAEEFMPKTRCGDWNQSLMELGAIICTVNSPKCSACPLRNGCLARKLGVPEALPVSSGRAKKIEEREIGLLVHSPAGVLIVQLPAMSRRWGTMWTIPTRTIDVNVNELEASGSFAKVLGLNRPVLIPYSKQSYIVTRHRITLVVFAIHHRTSILNLADWADHRWVKPSEAVNYAMSTHQRRLFSEARPTLFDENCNND